ncbi:MAG: hypothetical protein PVH19_08075 [Planctomycetia bacterium]
MKNFSRPLILLVALGLMLSCVTATYAGPKAEVVSLALTKGKAPFDNDKKYDTQKESSTELKILVTVPKKKILDFKAHDSKLLRFGDDQNSDFMKDNRQPFWPFIDNYDHKQQCLVTIKSPHIPSPKADKIHLKAKLVFQCASDKTKTEEAKVTPSKGGSFTLDGTKVNVSDKTNKPFDMSQADYQKKGHVLFKSSKSFDGIASIAFFGPDGKKIKHKESDSGSMSFMGKTEHELGYVLDKKVKTYTVKITYYAGAETVTIPIDQKIGVGF